MRSDQDIGKKEIETSELIPFLDAYECVTGEKLSFSFDPTENPDFICQRPDGGILGVELTKVTEDRAVAFWQRLRYGEVMIDPFKCQETIHNLIERKEKARVAPYAANVRECILVLQLMDGSLRQVRSGLDGLQQDFESHGFSEIWIADYSGLDAYGDVELFGLFPAQWRGYHQRPWPDRKPYG